MASKEYYTPAEAQEITGASKPALRIYTNRYRRWFSTEATPEEGMTRKFTGADLKLIAYIRQQTSLGATHEEVLEQLAAGALENFAWESPSDDVAESNAQGNMLIPLERLQATQALLHDARAREDTIRQENVELHQKLEAVQKELGHAQGELAAYRRRRPTWWIRLFGE